MAGGQDGNNDYNLIVNRDADTNLMSQPSWRSRLKYYFSLITVEPTMVFYMMAFMTTTVVEQAFFVHKACTVNHNLNNTICDNLTSDDHQALNKEVQITVSNFHQWNDIAGHVGQILLAFFMGAWADRRGRKLPLLMGLIGKCYYSIMVVVNALQDTWPVEYIIYTATLPMAFTGADVAIFAAAFTYVTDVSSQENRTLRVTILEVCYLATMPIGIAVGNVLYNGIVNKSYAVMFTINSSLMVLAILYTCLRLEWRTSERQRPLSEAKNVITDFFDKDHLVQTANTLFKKRPLKRRTYLLLMILAMSCYTFQRDEKPMMYLYVQLVFKWTLSNFSNFKTYVSALQDVVLLLVIPFLSKVLGWKDTFIIMFGAVFHSAARFFYAYGTVGWVLYIGGTFAGFGPVVAPVIRSMVSKMISATERGKVFSILSVADNAIPLISGVLYTQIYNATIHTEPSSIYYLTIATQLAVLVITIFIHFDAKENALIHEEEEISDNSSESDRYK